MSGSTISVLFLTKYARAGASSRYRTLQYLPYFEAGGICAHVVPLFDDDYLRHRYELGRSRTRDIVRGFIRRLCSLISVRRFDLAVVEYELLTYFPSLPERWLTRIGVPYVADYDDALFHQYDLHRNVWVRRLLGKKIASVMRGAKLVTVGNAYLADYAHAAGARRVEVVPTVVDLDRYPLGAIANRLDARPTIGWIGSPATARYLPPVAPALAEVSCRTGVRTLLVGSGPISLTGVETVVEPWSEETEVASMRHFDVGIMPLANEPWERGKCGLKLIQYMACGLPVVASPVSANLEIVEHGINGFLAGTKDEWVRALSTLLGDADLRRRMGEAGRKKVESRYSLQVSGPRLCSLLRSAAAKS